MTWITTLIVSAALVPVTMSVTDPGGAHATPDVEPVRFMVAHGPPDQVDLVDAVVRRFERAGLRLPRLSVAFHSDKSSCGGVVGHHHRSGGRSFIDVCVSPDEESGVQRHVIAHELAHAWAESTLDDSSRRDFLALRGLTSWNDGTTPWRLRGSEHAAEVVAWGALERSSAPEQIGQTSCENLQAAYFQLTGRLPASALRSFDGGCA